MWSLLISAFAALALASPTPPTALTPATPAKLEARQAQISSSPYVAPGPNPRATWGNYNLSTNYYTTIPNTGKVRTYWFDIGNYTAAPDGRSRNVLLVNGSFPGPTIIADWGDTVVVHVTNSMTNNGSSIHFHGVRQLNTNQMDGVQSITQCPIAPGSSYTYTWRAEQYGTSWWHAHFSLQAWEGVFGGIIINGPASADYDVDLGHVFLNDWDVATADAQYIHQITTPGITHMDSGLINGTNTFTFPNGTTVGKKFATTFQPGKRYRMRLVGSALHSHFKFSIDNHNLTVIANDFVPIVPFTTNVVTITMGQRYDIIVTANQQKGNFFMRSIPQAQCSNHTAPANNITGIVNYQGTPIATPNTTQWNYGDDFYCYDMPMNLLVPYLQLDANITNANYFNKSISISENGTPTIYLWSMGGTAPLTVKWNAPTIQQTSTGNTNFTAGQNAVLLNNANQWNVFVIQNHLPIAHPLHLHGHDFWVLAQGPGLYNPNTVTLNTKNPPRRDTANLDIDSNQNGYLVVAFPSDNPGAWIFHCHIGFHTPEGFGLQLVERPSEIQVNANVMNQTCNAWNAYAKTNPYGVLNQQYVGAWDSGV